jgi:Fic family protein
MANNSDIMQENHSNHLDCFNKRIKISPAILSKIAAIDEFKGLWKGSFAINPVILKRLRSTVIITSTGASTRIEGATMSDKEIARLLRGLKSNPPKNRDEQEVAGYADLIGRIFDHYKSLKLTENNILHFHGILLQYSQKDQSHKGKYKMADNVVQAVNEKGERVIVFKATPPYLVKPEMEAALAWAAGELEKKEVHEPQSLHPLLVIANFIFEFLAIHPFSDGNGRLSRALTNLLLLRADYAYIPYVSLDEIIEDTRAEYYMALHKTQNNHKTDHEDITPWLDYFLDLLITHATAARKLMEGNEPEKLLAESQEKILELFERGKDMSISDIMNKLGNAPRENVKKNLARLVDLRLLELVGQGRGARYRKISK